MEPAPARMSRLNCWRNSASTSGSSSTTRISKLICLPLQYAAGGPQARVRTPRSECQRGKRFRYGLYKAARTEGERVDYRPGRILQCRKRKHAIEHRGLPQSCAGDPRNHRAGCRTAWARIEVGFYAWFEHITAFDMRQAKPIYYSATNFKSRLDLLRAAMDGVRLERAEEMFIKAAMDVVIRYNSFRNKLAHGLNPDCVELRAS